jgi:hypothetical protein
MLSEKGSLRETPALKLLLTIFEQGLTGILYIKREDILKVLYFSRGKLIWAISNSDVDKLENLLLSRGLVDPVAIKKIKTQARVSDSIGKLLVEQGLITLEELIGATKEQLRRIIISVLKWKDGGFQFIKDAPPERLLSLDLEITQFVVDFIVEEVELSEIWKEIGSLQVEFIKNPDEQKLAKYHLSDKQKELLNSFDGEKKLEAILSRHASGHRESLLKIIYFFLMAELLIKKAFELSDLSLFDAYKGLDVFEPDPGEKKNDTPKHLEPPVAPEPAEESVTLFKPVDQEEEEFNAPDQPGEEEGGPYIYDKDSGRNAAPAMEDTEPPLPPMPADNKSKAIPPLPIMGESSGGKKPVKIFNIILIMIFLIFFIGGVIFLLLPLVNNSDSMKDILKEADKKGVKDIITIEEKKPPPLKTDTEQAKATSPGSVIEEPEEKTAKATTDQKQEEKVPDTTPKTREPETKEPVQKSDKNKKDNTPPTPSLFPGKSAISYFREGNYITAGDVWKKELVKAGVKYGILLEMDCLKESVKNAFGRLENTADFFILNRSIGRKTCFLVMWGKFHSESEATDAIKSIPSYFWQQKDPPEVIDLSPYL